MPRRPTDRYGHRVNISRALSETRDDEGRLILGNPNSKCHSCGSTAAVTISTCNRVAFWHPPTNCCQNAIEKNKRARAAEDREMQKAKDDYERYWISRGGTPT